MKTSQRFYSDAQGDFDRLCHFIMDHDAHFRRYSTWCLGRLVDWKYGLWGSKADDPGFCQHNARLWFDGFGDLAGFAISENGGADIAILTTAGQRFLFDEILQWALFNWGRKRGGLSIEITAQQTIEAAVLERAGFQRTASFYTFQFDLTAPLPGRFPLAEGFKIVDMLACPDYRAQRLLRAEAFEGKASLSEEELERDLRLYNWVHEGPIYHARTDLCVAAPDGTFVSGCEALIDAHNASADIERVCTHSAYRKRGLARAVIQECLYRLQDMGLRTAYITGYSPSAIATYASLGGQARAESWGYTLAAGA